jgi:hypothetical protein
MIWQSKDGTGRDGETVVDSANGGVREEGGGVREEDGGVRENGGGVGDNDHGVRECEQDIQTWAMSQLVGPGLLTSRGLMMISLVLQKTTPEDDFVPE